MKSDIQQMLATAYELEGLLLLAESRGDDTSETVYRSIHEKIETLRRLAGYRIDLLCGGEFGDEVCGVTGFGLMEAVERSEARAFGGEDIAPEEKVSEISAYENDEEMEELSRLMASGPGQELASKEESVTEREEDAFDEQDEALEDSAEEACEEVEVELVYADDAEGEEASDEQAEETEKLSAEMDDEVRARSVCDENAGDEESGAVSWNGADEVDGSAYDDVEVELVYDEEAADGERETEEAGEVRQESADRESLRLDEVLSRHRSKDLKSAFSLNDMFRFRRELFGNSAAEMTDAIHLVEAMSGYEEAEDYFYGDLEWDKDSDEVKEFMDIIKKHFL